MTDPVLELTRLAQLLQDQPGLDEVLQAIANTTAILAGGAYASLRLLDPESSRLLAHCRSGEPLYSTPGTLFAVGEGLLGTVVERREPLRTGDADADPNYAPREGMKNRLQSFLGVPLIAQGSCVGVLSVASSAPDAFNEDHERWLVLLATICAPHVELGRLRELAFVDPLTGALNRRGMERDLPTEGNQRKLSAVMLDIDHFKRLNDTHGHAAGDEVLRSLSRALRRAVRQEDLVVRMGGEEFLLLLSGTDLATARRVAERARHIVASGPTRWQDQDLHVTVSAGVACQEPGEDRESLVRRADQALYRAKEAGRDQVEVAPPTGLTT